MDSGQAQKGPKCPWGAPKNPAPITSLEDVMSEQLASDLQVKEEAELFKCDDFPNDQIPPGLLKDHQESTSDDLMIAQMLQMQFVRYDEDDVFVNTNICLRRYDSPST